jgi:hypothetical protein
MGGGRSKGRGEDEKEDEQCQKKSMVPPPSKHWSLKWTHPNLICFDKSVHDPEKYWTCILFAPGTLPACTAPRLHHPWSLLLSADWGPAHASPWTANGPRVRSWSWATVASWIPSQQNPGVFHDWNGLVRIALANGLKWGHVQTKEPEAQITVSQSTQYLSPTDYLAQRSMLSPVSLCVYIDVYIFVCVM